MMGPSWVLCAAHSRSTLNRPATSNTPSSSNTHTTKMAISARDGQSIVGWSCREFSRKPRFRGVGKNLIVLSDRRLLEIQGRQYAAVDLAEADAYRAGPLAPAAKYDGIAVLEKGAGFAAADLHRLAAARAQLEQRPGLRRRGSRLGSGSEQIAGAQIAAVDGVVRNELRGRPERMSKAGRGQPVGRLLPLAHGGTLYQDIEPNIERAGVAVPHRVQIRQGRRGALGPRERNAKRSQRLQRHDPWRNRRREILRQERPQRLLFPCLQIARRPVIEQTQAKDMRLGIRHRNRPPARIARTDEDAEFELVVQAIARPYRGRQGAGGKPLTMRPGESLARDTDGRTAAMVADRYPAVIRQQRIVRPHQPADRRRVMNRRVEIGVVADLRRQRILRVALRHQTAAQRWLQR